MCKFKLKNKEFEVSEAIMSLSFSKEETGENKLLLCLDIEMEEQWIDNAWWSPRLYHEDGFKVKINSWKELEGFTSTWDSKYNENDEEAGCLYVFEHEDVTSGKIKILERQDNNFKLRWTGKGNIYWDDEYSEDVPFELECLANFSGIYIGRSALSDEELNLELSKLINIDEFSLVRDKNFVKYVPIF